MRRKRIEIKINEDIKVSESSSFVIEIPKGELAYDGTKLYRLIEWDIHKDGYKLIDDIRQGSQKFILDCIDKRFNMLIKIVQV